MEVRFYLPPKGEGRNYRVIFTGSAIYMRISVPHTPGQRQTGNRELKPPKSTLASLSSQFYFIPIKNFSRAPDFFRCNIVASPSTFTQALSLLII